MINKITLFLWRSIQLLQHIYNVLDGFIFIQDEKLNFYIIYDNVEASTDETISIIIRPCLFDEAEKEKFFNDLNLNELKSGEIISFLIINKEIINHLKFYHESMSEKELISKKNRIIESLIFARNTLYEMIAIQQNNVAISYQ